MAITDSDRNVSFNVSFFVVGSCIFFLSKYITPSADIVKNPLVVAEVLATIIAIVNCLRTLQMSKPKVGNVAFGSVILILSVVAFHVIAVLYGAALTTDVSETFHFALLLTMVTVLPSLCMLGPNSEAWLRVYFLNKPESLSEISVQWTTACSLFGAWLGAFPIPLDWDRPWQVWPISCLIGTMTGYLIGLLFGAIHIYRHGDDYVDNYAKYKIR